MAEPYDVLASLNRMLESEERREQTKLQSSLALMQFAQSKRMADIQLAGQQLELLQAANSQMMGNQSQSFLVESGLDALYLSTLNEDSPEEGVTSMNTQLKKKWKLTPEEANRVVGSVYASKAGNHQGILNIGKDLHSTIELGEMSSIAQKSLFTKFAKSAPSLNEDRFSSMDKTASNQSKILQEMFEFGQGEYDISPDISMQEIQEASPEEIDESLIKLSEETDNTIGESKVISMLDNMTLKDSVKSFDEQIQTLNTEIQGRREDSSNIDNQKRIIQTKQSSGISISESEEQFLNRTKELKALGEAEMKNLNNEIQNLSKERKKYKLAEATEKLGKITSGGIYGMDYISY
tara:strand:- start:389 stop:1441 length:1053 start_codon:yes stop_codon:yes gene_type:complete